jgi:hypothetical protein
VPFGGRQDEHSAAPARKMLRLDPEFLARQFRENESRRARSLHRQSPVVMVLTSAGEPHALRSERHGQPGAADNDGADHRVQCAHLVTSGFMDGPPSSTLAFGLLGVLAS